MDIVVLITILLIASILLWIVLPKHTNIEMLETFDFQGYRYSKWSNGDYTKEWINDSIVSIYISEGQYKSIKNFKTELHEQ